MNLMGMFILSPFESELDELDYNTAVKTLKDDMRCVGAFAETAAKTMSAEALMTYDTRATLRALIETARGKLDDAAAQLDAIDETIAEA